MQIAALLYVSLSELQTANPDLTEEWSNSKPKELETVLHGMGMNIKTAVEKQEVTHRNRFGNIITCPRWVGNERVDKEWLESGYASQEAKDKSLNNSMLTDLYRLRGCVE